MIYTDDNEILDNSYEELELPEVANIKELKKLIDEMPIGYRTIFLLNLVEGLSHTEIAKHLGISRNTSKSQYRKARTYLQTKLKCNA